MYIQQQEDRKTIKAVFTFSDFPQVVKVVKELQKQYLEDIHKEAEAIKEVSLTPQ